MCGSGARQRGNMVKTHKNVGKPQICEEKLNKSIEMMLGNKIYLIFKCAIVHEILRSIWLSRSI